MHTVYVIQCERGRYYVGRTSRSVDERLAEHIAGLGSEWTRIYRPIRVVEQIPESDPFDEDKLTKVYMRRHGIDRVRGGSYTQTRLPEHSLMALEAELKTASDECFRCGRLGHYAPACYARAHIDGTPLEGGEKTRGGRLVETIERIFGSGRCRRCGRRGHSAEECYARTRADGRLLRPWP